MQHRKAVGADDRYELEAPLGSGSVSSSFRGRDRVSGAAVVIKIARDLPRAQELLTAEAEMLRQVASRRIPRLLDSGRDRDTVWLVCEYIEGSILDEVDVLSVRDAVEVGRAIAMGLGDLHRHGLIHRDVKPSNVIVPTAPDGSPRYADAMLLDLGLAGRLEKISEDEIQTTSGGEIYGTPLYMAPEQVVGLPLDPRTDVYGLGALLFRLLFGRPPFSGADARELFTAIVKHDLVLPHHVPLPDGLREALTEMLAKDARERPRDGQAAYEALDPERPPISETTGAGYPVPVSVDELPRARRSSSGLPVVGGLLVVGALVVATLFLLPPDSAGPAESSGAAWFLIVFLSLGVGVASAGGIRRFIAQRRRAVAEREAARPRAMSDEELFESLLADTDGMIEACQQIGTRAMAKSCALVMREYKRAGSTTERVQLLRTATEMFAEMRPQFDPWYVRYQTALTWGVGLFGGSAAAFKVALEIRKLLAG